MAPSPKSITNFIHPKHPLNPIDCDKEYLCDGCKTLGTGKRYRCQNGCDFDMHEYCGTCPNTLSSFMHNKHALTLVVRKEHASRQVNRICDVCTEPVEGLFYECKECEFDVHPLCTQFPDKLNHAMDNIHPLRLESPSINSPCAVCGNSCNSWRYRCGICNFDIHLQCVLTCSKTGKTTNRGINPGHGQGIPYQPPPQFAYHHYNPGLAYAPGYGYGQPGFNYNPQMYYHHNNPGFAYAPGYGYGQPGFNYNPQMYYDHYNPGFAYAPGYGYGQPGFNYNPQMYPHGFTPHNQQVGASTSGGSVAGRIGKSMFSLVSQIAIGVISNMIFGMDSSG